VVRTVMSFRFTGDFFDRYWTCHFLEHKPRTDKRSVTKDGKARIFKLDHGHKRRQKKTKYPWQQRKVLELVLMDEILNEMASSARNVLDWAKNTLQGGFQKLQQKGSDNYLSLNERWRVFEQILQAVEEDLDENLERIKEWRARESDRGLERPRWTRNDERRYRPTMTRLSVLTKRKTRELERLKQNIQSFREALTRRLTSIRDDISFRGSENINLFTYVTVVFLPLGFTTGIFSMSEAPSRTTLIQMVITAIIALAITIGALINARLLDKEIVEPALKIIRSISRPVIVCPIKTLRLLFNALISPGKSLHHLFEIVCYMFDRKSNDKSEQTTDKSDDDGKAAPTPPPQNQGPAQGSTTPRELENGSRIS
ncbi:uncharacterized protein K452DRAFT_225473, partial [Aplosporella prunicola CBS 121167]